MIVLGIDPGFDRLGWATAQLLPSKKLNLLSYGLIETDKKKTLNERYLQIDREITALIKEFHVDQAAMESLFFFRNKTTIVTVAQARGIVLSCLLRSQVEIFEYSPPQIKMAVTGYGRADKAAIGKMVRLQFKLDELGKKAPIIDDTYDAMAVLLTHAGSYGLQQKLQTKN